MSFIIDIFENLLKYDDKEIFIVLDVNNNIWFKMKDIMIVLGYYNITKFNRLKNIDKHNFCKLKMLHLSLGLSMVLSKNHPKTQFVNESGLYQLLSHSKKEIAVKFRDELFTSILPSIRKTGSYKLKEKDNNKLQKLNQKLIKKIKKIEEENNYYKDKHIYKPTDKSYIYILKKNIDTKEYFKIGFCDDIKQRMAIYKTGKANIDLIYYISIKFDGKQMEDCVKNINKLHLLKKKTDDLCYLSLVQLKYSIKDCLKKFNNHICKCTYCKKKLKFKRIDKHICK